MSKRPTIEFYDDREVVVINGTKYSYAFFDKLGLRTARIGAQFQVSEVRQDGNVVLTLIDVAERHDLGEKPDGFETRWQKPILEQLKEIRLAARNRLNARKHLDVKFDRRAEDLARFVPVLARGQELIDWWRTRLNEIADDLLQSNVDR